MAIAVDLQLSGLTTEQYAQMIDHIDRRLAAAPGFLSHAAGPSEGGFHIVELWRTHEDWARFSEEVIAPFARATGISPVARVERIERLVTSPHTGPARERTAPPPAAPS